MGFAASTLSYGCARPKLTNWNEVAPRDLNDEEPLVRDFIYGLTANLETDGMMVAWHSAQQPLRRLLLPGQSQQDQRAERDLNDSATRWARAAIHADKSISGITRHSSGDVETAAIPLPGTVVTISGLVRHPGTGISAACGAAMARLLPLAEPFFRIWSQRQDLNRQVRDLTAALDNSNVATFVISHRGELLFANRGGDELLAQDSGLSGEGGLLSALRPWLKRCACALRLSTFAWRTRPTETPPQFSPCAVQNAAL